MITGKQYLPDVGFEQGWNDPNDGGSRGWGIPPVIGYDPTQWGDVDRDTYLQPDLGFGWNILQTEPLYESWQQTPGHALHVATDYNGGLFIGFNVAVVPGRKYLVRYGKKIINSVGLYPALFVRILWKPTESGLSFSETQIGREDSDPGIYTYEQVVTPPTIAEGFGADANWARVMMYVNGQGGPDASMDGYFDDVQFAVLTEPPEPPGPDGPSDSGSLETEVGRWMYDALEPLQEREQQLGFPLLAFADAIGGMFQPTYDIVKDPNILLDPDRTPVGWLPWLGQFVGQQVKGGQLPDESDADYRTRVAPLIRNPAHRRRGTVPAILEEVAKFLNPFPTPTIYAVERQGGNLYIGSIGVITSQIKLGYTVADIQARIEAIQPAGRIITVTGLVGGDWLSLRTTHSSWSDVLSTYDDWAEVRANPTL
jgi:hypothetical protein